MFNTKERIAYLEKKAAEMTAFLNEAPSGNLVCRHFALKKWRYYQSDHDMQRYIPQSEESLAVKLAIKKLYKKTLRAAEKEAAALKRFSDAYGNYEKDIEAFFTENPGCARLIRKAAKSSGIDLTEKIKAWEKEEYKKDPHYSEFLYYKTLKGEKVRSKSEAAIANFLYLAGIPYRYECELKIGNEIFYPDFTIMDPTTGDIYIWEHFGLMDMEKYRQRTIHKINTYTAAGYFPNMNFIITYENDKIPFSDAQAAEEIERFFNRGISSLLPGN